MRIVKKLVIPTITEIMINKQIGFHRFIPVEVNPNELCAKVIILRKIFVGMKNLTKIGSTRITNKPIDMATNIHTLFPSMLENMANI